MSFFYGLVEGLATSANEALKNDIKRINTRVDSIAERQLEKALREQEKRAAEVSEVEAALKEGYALFGGDANSVKAKQYAAGLLKEMGSLDAYKDRIAELRTAKNDQGQDLGQFFSRASEDSPTGSFTDYANAFLGAPKTFAGDYRVPEGMRGERPAGGLVSKVVGKPIDVVQMGLTRAKEDITAAIGDTTFESVSLPTITFHAEKFKMSGMKASERIEYINNKLANPDNTEKRNEELQGMLSTALTAAAASGDMTTKLDATKQMISRETDPDKLQKLFDDASQLSYNIDMAEAKSTGSKIGILDAEIKRQQYLNNIDKVRELTEQKKALSGEEKTQSQITQEMEEELLERVNSGDISVDSDEFKLAQQEIDNRKENERLIQGVGNVTESQLNSARSYFTSVENDIISQLLGGADGKAFVTIATGIENKMLVLEELPQASQDIYYEGLAKQKQARQITIDRLRPLFETNPAIEQHIKNITGEVPLIAESGSLSGQTTSSDTSTDKDTATSVGDQTTEAISTDAKPTQPNTADVTGEATEEEKLQYPQTVEGALSIIERITKVNGNPQNAYQAAMDLHGDEQFATTVEFIASKDDTGLDGLEKRIAEMALQGLNANQITQQLKQVEYAGDTSMDVASISSTVAKVLSELNPESRNRRILNQQRASEARQQQLEDARKPRPSLQLPSGLMSKQ